VGERELESWLEELLDVRPPDVFLLLNFGDSEDLDIPKSGSVSSGHVLVHGLDSLGSGKSSELLDHVVGTGSGVVSEPDGEVLDLQWLLLRDDVQSDNLSAGLLDLLQLSEVVPVSRLGDNVVWRKDPHSAMLSDSLLRFVVSQSTH